MEPIFLPNATHKLIMPIECDEKFEEYLGLTVMRDGECIHSFWRPSVFERLKILFGEPIQLTVHGQIHPPVQLSVAKYAKCPLMDV